jgi:hypothetical protein
MEEEADDGLVSSRCKGKELVGGGVCLQVGHTKTLGRFAADDSGVSSNSALDKLGMTTWGEERAFGGHRPPLQGVGPGKSKNWKTNPSLIKPAWKFVPDKAKNEPKF